MYQHAINCCFYNIIHVQSCARTHHAQSTLAPPPVTQAPLPIESAVEPELVGDNGGTGLAIGLVS